LLDTISHEFLAPIVGIRGNASFLQRRIHELSTDLVATKLNDIIVDSEMLLHQVERLGYILGRTPPPRKREKTLVFRDIIIKTINQLKPVLSEKGFDTSKVNYDVKDISRIEMYVDRANMQQIVYSLLTNSIKYAEENPENFMIKIIVDEAEEFFIIRFQDFGIGIKEGLEEKIFERGFRAPEAIRGNVTGSGLGLTIARDLMREIGGDLTLSHNNKPTEFKMILPKSLEEAPYDTIHR
jgi:signal transduction histidine kinase